MVLALAVCAVLAGSRSLAAIGQWANNASEQVKAALVVGDVPCESTMVSTLQRLNGDTLDTAIGAWSAEHTAVDGKDQREHRIATLLDNIELADAVVTADALHAQHVHADYLVL